MNYTTTNQRDKVSITRFIQNLGEKNYAQANANLKKTIQNKISDRISKLKNINIFRNE
jgi:hypothetical protein